VDWRLLPIMPTKSLLLVVAICFVFSVLADDSIIPEDDSMIPEYKVTYDAEGIGYSPDEVLAMQSVSIAKRKSAKAILNSIMRLRAYCVAARDKAEDFKDSTSKTNGIVDLIMIFGKVVYAKSNPSHKVKLPGTDDLIPDIPVKLPRGSYMPAKKVVVGNIVVEYARAIRKLRSQFGAGLSKYLLVHLNKAVMRGKTSLARITNNYDRTKMMGFDHKVLGLQQRPRYFAKLAVPFTAYQTKLHEVVAQASNADTAAAAIWLQSGKKKAYVSFLHREVKKINSKRKEYNSRTHEDIVRYVSKEFKKAREGRTDKFIPGEVVRATVSFADSSKVKSFKARSDKEIRKLAQKAASEWRKANNKKNALKEEIKKIEGKAPCPVGNPNCMCPGTRKQCPKKMVPVKGSPGCSLPRCECNKCAKRKQLEKSVYSPLVCTTSTKSSNTAGVIKPDTPSGGYTLVGGGMDNKYRSFDKLSAFEEAFPKGNQFQCDTGFGPGKLRCQARYCKTTGLKCVTKKSRRQRKGGTATVSAPKGYVMTGGGLFNHYRRFNKKAHFERSHPFKNGWIGDMGYGWGDYTVYVRACKGVTCKTVQTGIGNSKVASCPKGYQITSCGSHQKNGWGALGAFEQYTFHGNGCHCDMGFGSGKQRCYARCCKGLGP
jgi:hypothetical protein